MPLDLTWLFDHLVYAYFPKMLFAVWDYVAAVPAKVNEWLGGLFGGWFSGSENVTVLGPFLGTFLAATKALFSLANRFVSMTVVIAFFELWIMMRSFGFINRVYIKIYNAIRGSGA